MRAVEEENQTMKCVPTSTAHTDGGKKNGRSKKTKRRGNGQRKKRQQMPQKKMKAQITAGSVNQVQGQGAAQDAEEGEKEHPKPQTKARKDTMKRTYAWGLPLSRRARC